MCQEIKRSVTEAKKNIEEIFEAARLEAIEDVLKKARNDLIRKNMIKLIFQETTKQLVIVVYNYDNEKQEALEVAMDEAHCYLKRVSDYQSLIIPLIYPDIFNDHFFPEQRDLAVKEALRKCKSKLMNDRQIQELERRILIQQKLIKDRVMHQMR